MAFMPLTSLYKVGMIKDQPNYAILPEGFSDAMNVSFTSVGVERVSGNYDLYDSAAISHIPYYLFTATKDIDNWSTINVGLSAIEASIGATHTNLTPGGGWTHTTGSIITGNLFNGLPILNSEASIPHYWTNDLADNFEPLPGLDASVRFKVLRPFKNFLIGLGYKDVGDPEINPYGVWWSDTADPGDVPNNWDYADPTSLAGRYPLADTAGEVVDALILGDTLFIYKTDSVYTMQLSGRDSVFKFATRFTDFGMLASQCGVALKNGHFVITQDDFIIHNGMDYVSVGDTKVRRWFFQSLERDHYKNTFIVMNHPENELWIYFPVAGSGVEWPTRVLIYNWIHDTFSQREVNETTCATSGYPHNLGVGGATWASAPPVAWPSQTRSWRSQVSPRMVPLVVYGELAQTIQVVDAQVAFDGVFPTAYVARYGIPIDLKDRADRPISVPKAVKQITEIWPFMAGNVTQPMVVTVGGQEYEDGPVTWNAPFSYLPGVNKFVPVVVSAPFLAIKFEWDHYEGCVLTGYSIVFESVGDFQ